MQFKGHNFRQNTNLVMLPNYDEDRNPMPYVEEGYEAFVYFGKVVKIGKKKPVNAIKTTYKWQDSEEAVYAVPLELKGHSLTNMAYGVKDQIYLAKDGCCCQSLIKRI